MNTTKDQKIAQKFRDFKGSFSDFWRPSTRSKSLFDSETRKIKDTGFANFDEVLEMSSVQKAVQNFVKIVTSKNIPVKFATSDTSFTDGKIVTISGKIESNNFDSTVGLALHEASHIKLTDFSLLLLLSAAIPQELYDKAQTLKISKQMTEKIIKDLLNWVEDRRIDHFMYSKAPGYRGYYQSLYNRYFYSKTIGKGLKSKHYRDENLTSYRFRIINLMSPDSDLDALRGLREIYNIVDLPHIERLENSRDALQVALNIFSTMLKYLSIRKAPKKVSKKEKEQEKQNSNGQKSKQQQNGEGDGDGEPMDTGWGEDDDNEQTGTVAAPQSDETKDGEKKDDEKSDDTGDGKKDDEKTDDKKSDKGDSTNEETPDTVTEGVGTLTKKEKEQLEEDIKNQDVFLDGEIEKEEISEELANTIETVANSGSEIADVKYETRNSRGTPITAKVPVTVIRNVTESFMLDDYLCMFANYTPDSPGYFESYVVKGVELGRLLGRKLQIRNEDKITHYTRQDSGRIERRLLAELGFGNTSVFAKTTTEKFNRAFLHISIDASDSMNGNKLGNAIQMSVAIAKFAEMTNNIDVVISFRSDYGGIPTVVIMYDSRKDKFSKVRRFFPYMKTFGGTPEGLVFAAIQKEIEDSTKETQSYFVNLSDGEPCFWISQVKLNAMGDEEYGESFYYSGEPAFEHTRKEVEKMRARGVKILSYSIGYGTSYGFNEMYGRDAYHIDPNSIVEIAKSLEKKFSEKE